MIEREREKKREEETWTLGRKQILYLLLSLFVGLVVLLASCCSSFFEETFDPLLGPLVVDFGSPR